MSTALIGVTAILPAIQKLEGIEATAVASRSMEKATAFALEHQIPTAYGSYQELLDDPTLEGIYIPLPNSQHLEWAAKEMSEVLLEALMVMALAVSLKRFSAPDTSKERETAVRSNTRIATLPLWRRSSSTFDIYG